MLRAREKTVSNNFQPGDKVLYMRQYRGHKPPHYQDIPAEVLRITKFGYFTIRLYDGKCVSVAQYALKRPPSAETQPDSGAT